MKIVHEIRGLISSGEGGVRPYQDCDNSMLPVDGYVDEIVVIALPL